MERDSPLSDRDFEFQDGRAGREDGAASDVVEVRFAERRFKRLESGADRRFAPETFLSARPRSAGMATLDSRRAAETWEGNCTLCILDCARIVVNGSGTDR